MDQSYTAHDHDLDFDDDYDYDHADRDHDYDAVRQYKPRFECMEQCYSSYTALSPHHSLARYCIQVAAPYFSDLFCGGLVKVGLLVSIKFLLCDAHYSLFRPRVPTPRLGRSTR